MKITVFAFIISALGSTSAFSSPLCESIKLQLACKSEPNERSGNFVATPVWPPMFSNSEQLIQITQGCSTNGPSGFEIVTVNSEEKTLKLPLASGASCLSPQTDNNCKTSSSFEFALRQFTSPSEYYHTYEYSTTTEELPRERWDHRGHLTSALFSSASKTFEAR